MQVLVLSATYETKVDSQGREVPLPLVDIHKEREPYLTTLVKKLLEVPGLTGVVVVTNDHILPQLTVWADDLGPQAVPVRVLGDGTRTPETRRGAVGDILYAIHNAPLTEDLLVVGGDNWFQYDLPDFLDQARRRPPAVVVTPFRPTWGSSRFGVVRLGDEGRIVQFLEKPTTSELTLKASCVYYFAAADLRWFDVFAAERTAKGETTCCTPGTFLAWMVGRGEPPVQAVVASGAWYDIGGGPARGPDTLEFTSLLRKSVAVAQATWERPVARWLECAVSSYEYLLDVLQDPEPNRRILAARVLGLSGHLLTERSRPQVVGELVRLLADPAVNEIGYGDWQSDEETAFFVSATAAEALASLGYAADAPSVFARARGDGVAVQETRNKAW